MDIGIVWIGVDIVWIGMDIGIVWIGIDIVWIGMDIGIVWIGIDIVWIGMDIDIVWIGIGIVWIGIVWMGIDIVVGTLYRAAFVHRVILSKTKSQTSQSYRTFFGACAAICCSKNAFLSAILQREYESSCCACERGRWSE